MADSTACPARNPADQILTRPAHRRRERPAADLNAGHLYSGRARDKIPGESESGDQWAWTGRENNRYHHVNTMKPEF
ncbi:hypothetical protein [Arthrobacter bambusae]|uniref:Uncharacterized protein n=1 Tax=Arthrobacter bambusae TaxID=1338426 RepID=A0AAW8D6K4_9MICC|nr:hypothetical protein [Arthrobacter bambusae]MDP9904541.1 hypothetical protein [Arthrobacter bambusae]MDQ0129356.1 hypothetical protein [Arthrobacter bambusae]